MTDEARRGFLKGAGIVGAGGLLSALGSKTAQASQTAVALVTSIKTASYSLRSSDAGNVIEFNAPGEVTLTIPLGVGVSGDVVEVCQVGHGQVRVIGAVDSSGSNTTRAQFSTLSLRRRADGRWVIVGDTI